MLKNNADSFKYFGHYNLTYKLMITSMGGIYCKIPNYCFDNTDAHKLWLDPNLPCFVSASQLFEVLNFTIDAITSTVDGSEWLETVQKLYEAQNANNETSIAELNENDTETSVTGRKYLAIGLSIGAVIGRVGTSL